MSSVKLGDEIAIHYRLHGPEGEVIAASGDGNPLAMRVGGSDVIIGLSAGVVGMQLHEIKSLHLAPEQAYGTNYDSIERFINKSDAPPDVVIGDKLRLCVDDKSVVVWVVAEQWGTAWRITTKHPYAGMHVAMTVKVIEHSG